MRVVDEDETRINLPAWQLSIEALTDRGIMKITITILRRLESSLKFGLRGTPSALASCQSLTVKSVVSQRQSRW